MRERLFRNGGHMRMNEGFEYIHLLRVKVRRRVLGSVYVHGWSILLLRTFNA